MYLAGYKSMIFTWFLTLCPNCDPYEARELASQLSSKQLGRVDVTLAWKGAARFRTV